MRGQLYLTRDGGPDTAGCGGRYPEHDTASCPRAFAAAAHRCRPQKPFDFMTYNMSGSPYAMAEKDALTYGRMGKDAAATTAVAKTMDQVRRTEAALKPHHTPRRVSIVSPLLRAVASG
jgi:hypothetical protein